MLSRGSSRSLGQGEPGLPARGDWLHQVKHDGHRLVAITAGERLRLISRNGYDRTALFREPFRGLAEVGLPGMVLDGEIGRAA